MNRLTVSRILRRLIVESNMTYAELSEKSGVSAKTISHWLHSEYAPSIESAECVLNVLGYKFDVVKCQD